MDKQTLEFFQRRALKSKEELLNAIDDYLTKLDGEDVYLFSENIHKPALIDLVSRFKRKIQRLDLAYLDKPFEAYEITITNNEIFLEVAEYTEILLDQDGEMESADSRLYPTVFELKAPFVPVREFAKKRDVSAKEAIDWIKKHKIKNAKKMDSGWYVSDLQGVPIEEAEDGSYLFIGDNGDLSTVSPLQEKAHRLTVYETEELREKCGVVLETGNYSRESMQISDEMLCSIEDALIRSPHVVFEFSIIDRIDEKVIPGFDVNPLLDIPQKRIIDFIDGLDLPDETKRALKAMVRRTSGDTLFVTTLEKLSLMKAFQEFVSSWKLEK